MIIKVHTGYRGVATKEQFIATGEYSSDDTILHGQAEFLVNSGRAVVLVPDEPKTPPQAPQAPKKAK